MSIAPTITFPTASTNNGLGDGIWRYRLPAQIGKTLGDYYVFAEFGYQWAAGGAAAHIFGMAVQTIVAPELLVGVELYSTTPTNSWSDYGPIANVGVTYVLSDHVRLLGSLGRTVRDTDRGGPEVLAQIFLQFNFRR